MRQPAAGTRSIGQHEPNLGLSRGDWLLLGSELGLSAQQLLVMRHILEGKKLAVIAGEMHLGLGTVKTYSQRIYRKLHVSSQCALATMVFTTFLRSEAAPGSRAPSPERGIPPLGVG